MKDTVKQLLLQLIEGSGINRFFRDRTRRRLLGLCYHGVIGDEAPWNDPGTWIAVSKTQFNLQMRELRRHWHPIALSELDLLFREGKPIPERSVFVTFDDGFLNNLTFAAPILREYGIPATIFLTTGLIGTDRTIWPLELQQRVSNWPDRDFPLPDCEAIVPFPKDVEAQRRLFAEVVEQCKKLPTDRCESYLANLRSRSEFRLNALWQRDLCAMLDWNDVRTLQRQGVEFGAHTVTHCNLAKTRPDDARAQLVASKEEIQRRLEIDCFSLAYPFGDATTFSDEVARIAKESGFRLAVTLCGMRNRLGQDPMQLDRFCVTGDLTLASFRALIAGWR